MQIPTQESVYPISLTEDFSKRTFRRTKAIFWGLAATSAAILVVGILQANNLLINIFSIIPFIFVIGAFVVDDQDDLTTLIIDNKGILVQSTKYSSKAIFLEWASITSIHQGWRSPQADASQFDRGLSVKNELLSFGMPDFGLSTTATISYKLPKRSEWREGRELREYQFMQTFGMSQQAFFDFLNLHFERNKRAQL